jgi:8-oxo-dGTP pyrophosphatase MutT (NUDIX family)
MPLKPWKVLASNYARAHVRIDKCETSNGLVVEPLILEYGTWVNVLALTEEEQVLLIQQYRHGIQDVIWELPGGMAEDGETALEAARRELLEETGFTGCEFIQTGRAYPNPASHTNTHYSVLALNVKKVSIQDLDDTEDIDVSLLPLDRVVEMAKRGELPQSLHLTTLFFALAHLHRIS